MKEKVQKGRVTLPFLSNSTKEFSVDTSMFLRVPTFGLPFLTPQVLNQSQSELVLGQNLDSLPLPCSTTNLARPHSAEVPHGPQDALQLWT